MTETTLDTPLRLNLGAGRVRIDGWTPIDRQFGSEAYPLKDYADGSVDEIRASHLLEHFPFAEVPRVLAEWARVLKPGSRMRVAVPDIDKLLSLDGDPMRERYLMGGQVDGNDFHRSAFTYATLAKYMCEAGLTNVKRWESDNTDTAAHKCSLNVEGAKPDDWKSPTQTGQVKILAMMSRPRYGSTDGLGLVQEALRPFGIPLQHGGSAWWHQSLQNLMEEGELAGLDWVLTIDYDTIFSATQLDTLFGQFGNNPHIDALAPMQPRRRGDTPLCTIEGETEKQITYGAPFQASTAHFGTTLIRVDALRDVPRPWFMGIPNMGGSYNDDHRDDTDRCADFVKPLRDALGIPENNYGRLDADIFFWHQWRRHGKTVYITPDVRVGHLEERVLAFDDDMNVKTYYIGEWREANGLVKEVQR